MKPTLRVALLALPAAGYFLLARHWRLEGGAVLAGDEPHYLILADALVRDGSAEVGHVYADVPRVRAVAGGPLETHAFAGPHGSYSSHYPGLSLLAALPWRLGGASAVRGLLALLAGLLPFLFEPILFEQLGDRRQSVALALALAAGLPFAAAANQIFPDLPTGLLVLALASALLGPFSGKARAAVALGLAFLPWLHLKNAAPAAILALPFAEGLWRERRALGPGRTAALAALPLVSMLGVAAYTAYAFGALRGPYGAGALDWDPRHWSMSFAGLHFDQAQGLFVQQPLFLLGLVGLVPWARRAPGRAALLGTLYASLLLPNAMHETVYGGWSFAGRFSWSSAPLWLFPLADGARLLREISRRALSAAAALGGLVDVHHLALVLPAPGYLRPPGVAVAPLWLYRGLWPALSAGLPWFVDRARCWRIAPNLCALAFAGVALATGAALAARRRRAALAGAAALAVILGLAFAGRIREPPPRFSAACFHAADLPLAGGPADEPIARDPAATDGRAVALGHAVRFGPYLQVPAGEYRYLTRIAAAQPDGLRLQLAVSSNALGPIAARAVQPSELPADGGYGPVALDFALPRAASDLELLTRNTGTPVREDRIGLFPRASAAAGLAGCPPAK